jgi:hypothetical protein
MDQIKINYFAVIVSAVIFFLLGWVWYGVLFSSLWMQYTGITMDQAPTGSEMAMQMGGSFIAYFITFYCLAHVNHAFQVKDVKGALQSGFWTWLGFIATVLFVMNLYQLKPFGLWLIDAGYWGIGLITGAIILVKMKKKEPAAAN